MTITHDALDPTLQPPPPQTLDLGPLTSHPTPGHQRPGTPQPWSLLDIRPSTSLLVTSGGHFWRTCSNLFIWGSPSGVATEALRVSKLVICIWNATGMLSCLVVVLSPINEVAGR